MAGPRVSLEQWRALVSVVESGGYAQAAESMHKSQSTVSYAVQKLESLLGVKAFEIDGRKAVLTPQGQVLFRRGKALLDEAARLEAVAGEMSRGWEAEVRLSVEITFPTWLLLRVLDAFARERPGIRIDVTETVLGGAEEVLQSAQVDLAVVPRIPPGFLGDPLMDIDFICTASPDHPLHALGRPVTRDDLRKHRHLIIRDSAQHAPRDPGAFRNETVLRVTNKATAIRAARMGMGYSWFPEPAIREELLAGVLQPVPLAEGGRRRATLFLVLADPDGAGPGARRLAELLRGQVAEQGLAVPA